MVAGDGSQLVELGYTVGNRARVGRVDEAEVRDVFCCVGDTDGEHVQHYCAQ